MSRKKKKKKVLTIISRFLWILSLISLGTLSFLIFRADVLPILYFGIMVGVFILFLVLHGFFVIKKNVRKWVLIVLDVIAVLCIAISVFAILKINDTLDFMRKNLNTKYETTVYHILVNKDSEYKKLKDIKGEEVIAFKDLKDETLLEKAVKKKVDVTFDYEENAMELLTDLEDDKKMIVVVNSGNYDAMDSIDTDYDEKVRILGSVKIKQKIKEKSTGVNVTKDSFVLYLSGIDTRTNALPARSLSDVNILLAVNPVDKKIAMVHIPRDYYVQLHGTTGYKDKLTHAGAVGGVELSMSTIEDLFGVDISYYAKLNFNAVVGLVDAIGGVTLNSDVNYSFRCKANKSCVINPGDNPVKGACALAFARERKAYKDGDRHRGENQEQLIEKVINKVSSSKTLISNYSSILNALDGTFQTNLTEDDLTSLVKMQLNDMASWSIEKMNVTGTGAKSPTYSYPYQNLYVMNPNMETVEAAKAKLNEVLGTKEVEE